MLSAFLVRIPVAYLLGMILDFGVIGVVYAIPIATLCGTIIAAAFYIGGAWKNNKVNI